MKHFLLSLFIVGAFLQAVLYCAHVPTRLNGLPAKDRSSARPVQVTANRGGNQGPTRGVTRDAWEYLIVEYPTNYPKGKALQGWLNEQGAQGWEQCAGNPYLSRFEFKRRSYRF